MYKQNLNEQINLNAVVIYIITALIATVIITLCNISLEVLENIPDLSLTRRMGILYSPTHGLTRAIWCLLHGDLNLAVKYNRFVFLLVPLLIYQYGRLIHQCFYLRIFSRTR